MNESLSENASVSPLQDCCAASARTLSDSEWVSFVFDQNHLKLVNYAAGFFRGDHDKAIDAVQETFLRLCKQPRDNVQDHVQAWLFRTCRNLIFDQLRQNQRMNTSDQTFAIADTRLDSDPSNRITREDELHRCSEQISQLPSQQQEVLNLRMTHGMSYKQIAAVTGMTVSNVGVTLHQAIHKLRATLAT